MELQSNFISSFCYNFYLRTLRYQRKFKFIRKYANRAWEKSLRAFRGETVITSIHGSKVYSNYGYTYPIICRTFPTYNFPLVELAYQTSRLKGSPISVVDIGAAIGDTVLLLEASCSGMIEKYYCVDGDDEFFKYLGANLSHKENVVLIKTFLSSTIGKAKSLVKIHPGTASAQGNDDIATTTLDQLTDSGLIGQFDLLKIDVDGFDGSVLLGSKRTLINNKPTIIFEWHPVLCTSTCNNWTDHFAALNDCGYDRFIFFDNYGNFSHFMNGIDNDALYSLAQILELKKHTHAEYFDVMAIHKAFSAKSEDLATLDFARTHKHPC